MSRNILRSVLATLAGAVIAALLVLAGGALAAKPKRHAHFAGHTSVPPVLGFRAPVSFTVAANGKSLRSFSYGSFGCFGAGGFRPGVNPYTGGSVVHVGAAVPVSGSGRIAVSGLKSSRSGFGQTTVTTIAISARFGRPRRASGTITFSQAVTGTFTGTCGPVTVHFAASAR